MKTLLSIIMLVAMTFGALAQGAAFTYQGRLTDASVAVGGTWDIKFALYDAASGGAQQGATLTNSAIPISGGLFTVTLDFGNQFPGAERWLAIAARTNGDGAFTTLNPRQQLTATPYAITAGNVTGPVSAAQVSGALSSGNLPDNPVISGTLTAGGGAVVVSSNGLAVSGALTVDGGAVIVSSNGLTAADFWQLGGNAGTTAGTHFLGTTDNQPLELKVNGERVLRLEPYLFAPNIIGGSVLNSISPNSHGVTIAGGAGIHIGTNSHNSAIGGGSINSIAADSDSATIGGGILNEIGSNSPNSAISGGYHNMIFLDSAASTISGGMNNDIRSGSIGATVGGGLNNYIGDGAYSSMIGGGGENGIVNDSWYAVIAGGFGNQVRGKSDFATIGGGYYNDMATNSYYSTIAGGDRNQIDASGATIGGGNLNKATGTGATIGGGSNNEADGGATVGGGSFNDAIANNATIGGGLNNKASGLQATIGGGIYNEAFGEDSTIGGGHGNEATNECATVGGGLWNKAYGNYATVPGGRGNQASGDFSFAAGQFADALHDNCFVWADGQGTATTTNQQVVMKASGGFVFYSNGAGWSGVTMGPGDSSWSSISDRNVKKNFKPVDGRSMLETLVTIPVRQWNYEWESDDAVAHIGPVAQDFKAAFYPGRDNKRISTLEFDGVALAAIQGLNQKLETQRAENAELKTRLEKLEQQMQHRAAGAK